MLHFETKCYGLHESFEEVIFAPKFCTAHEYMNIFDVEHSLLAQV